MNYRHLLVFIAVICLCACQAPEGERSVQESSSAQSLKSAFADDFFLGVAVSANHINGNKPREMELVAREFNAITAENSMKSMNIHPERDSFFFDEADRLMVFAEENDMHFVGHALVWHSQQSPWLEKITDSAEMAIALTEHINALVTRYIGKVDAWDVVNEALNEDGSYRESNFYKVMGRDYLLHAFREAQKADPEVDLIYNDYNLWKPEKRAGVVRLVKWLQDEGIDVDAVGMQGHWSLIGPDLSDVEASINAYAELGVDVLVSELDVTALPNPWDLEGAEISQNFEGSEYMDPYRSGLPDSVQLLLAERYEDIFRLFLKHRDKLTRVSFWGVCDGHSWLNGWPIEGRTNYPLLFDRSLKNKKAYDAVMALSNLEAEE